MRKSERVLEQTKERIARYAKEGKISERNKNLLLEFIDYLTVKDYSDVRKNKYLRSLSVFCYKDRNYKKQNYKDDFTTTSKKEMKELVSWINESYSSESARDLLVMLRIFVKWLLWIRTEKKERFDKNEYPYIVDWIKPELNLKKREKPKDILKPDDVIKLSEGAENVRDKALIMLLYESGAQIGELLSLKTSDIKFDEYGARITIPSQGKWKRRIIRLVSSVRSIDKWISEHPEKGKKNAPLFCVFRGKKKGKPLNQHNVRQMLRRTSKEINLNKPCNPQFFRDSRATELAKELTESQLCYYFGWVQGSKEVRKYIQLSDIDLEKKILEMHGIKKDEKKV